MAQTRKAKLFQVTLYTHDAAAPYTVSKVFVASSWKILLQCLEDTDIKEIKCMDDSVEVVQ